MTAGKKRLVALLENSPRLGPIEHPYQSGISTILHLDRPLIGKSDISALNMQIRQPCLPRATGVVTSTLLNHADRLSRVARHHQSPG
jgi:hypothetical protein